MHDNAASHGPLTYWKDLLGLCTGERVVQENLDIPLDKAGALAVAVAGGVIGFVLLLILRGFGH